MMEGLFGCQEKVALLLGGAGRSGDQQSERDKPLPQQEQDCTKEEGIEVIGISRRDRTRRQHSLQSKVGGGDIASDEEEEEVWR